MIWNWSFGLKPNFAQLALIITFYSYSHRYCNSLGQYFLDFLSQYAGVAFRGGISIQPSVFQVCPLVLVLVYLHVAHIMQLFTWVQLGRENRAWKKLIKGNILNSCKWSSGGILHRRGSGSPLVYVAKRNGTRKHFCSQQMLAHPPKNKTLPQDLTKEKHHRKWRSIPGCYGYITMEWVGQGNNQSEKQSGLTFKMAFYAAYCQWVKCSKRLAF